MAALHVFDMDGTLLRGTTAAIEISRRVGRLEALGELERGFATEEISAADFAPATRALWEDLTAKVVAEVVAAAPWIDGIEDVCADIAERGERSMLITMSPNFFADSNQHFVTLHHLVDAEGEPTLREPDKVEAWGWYPWDALPDPLFAPAASLIAGGWRPA